MALILLAGLALYFRLDKNVTLVIDGRAATLSTLSGTVGDLLEAEEVAVAQHDRVRPAASARLAEGMRIQVDHAKEIQLVLNGAPQTVYVIGQTVDDVLEQINLRAGQNAFLRPSRAARITDGTVIQFRRAVSVTLAVDGKSTDLITNAPDVGYLLDSLGVVLRRHDKVAPSAYAPLTEDGVIKVTRVRYARVTSVESVPFITKTRYTDRLIRGTRRVERYGVPGEVRMEYRVRKVDGKVVDREVLSREQLSEPVAQIVLVGTRNPNTQTGTASWYQRDGMVAAHKTLPKGTRVRVTNLANGKQVTVVIDDRGPFVKDWIIDLSDDAFAKLAPLGSGIIKVRLDW